MLEDFDELLGDRKFDEIIEICSSRLDKRPSDAEARWRMVQALYAQGDAQKTINTAEEHLKQMKEDDYYLRIWHILATNHLLTGNYFKALDLYEQQVDLAKRLENYEYQGRAANNRGIIYDLRGEYEQSLEEYQKALKYKKLAGEDSLYLSTVQNIALLKHKLGDADGALQDLKTMLPSYREAMHPPSLAILIANITEILIAMGKRDQVQPYLSELQQLVKLSDSERTNAYWKYVRASYLITSSKLKDKVRAEDLLLECRNNEALPASLRIMALKYLVEYRLIEFSIEQSEENLENIDMLVEELISIALEQELYPDLIDIYLLKIKFEGIRGNYSGTIKIFEKVQDIINKHDLSHFQDQVNQEKEKSLAKLKKMQKQVADGEDFLRRMEILEIEEYLKIIKNFS